MAETPPPRRVRNPYRTPSPTSRRPLKDDQVVRKRNGRTVHERPRPHTPSVASSRSALYKSSGSVPSSYQGSPSSVPSLSMTASPHVSLFSSLLDTPPQPFNDPLFAIGFDKEDLSIFSNDETLEDCAQPFSKSLKLPYEDDSYLGLLALFPKIPVLAPASNSGSDIPEAAERTTSPSVSERCTPQSDLLQKSKKGHSVAGIQPPWPEGPAAVQASRHPYITKWLHQSERSLSSSETNSVGSLESDVMDEEFGETDTVFCPDDVALDIMALEKRVIALDFTALFTQALRINNVPYEIVSQLYAIFMGLIETRMRLPPTNKSAAGEDTHLPSSNFPQARNAPDNPQSSKVGQKRPFGDDEKELPEGDDNNDRRKRPTISREIEVRSRQKWACPFYQREPHRYCVETEFGDFRKCARSPGFDQVHRVKDHIYKCHSPKYCDRCYAIFKKEVDLTDHRRLSPACDVKALQQVDGLTSEQKRLLKPRDRSSKSDEERWQTIYKICFPNDEVIPSAYYIHYSREIVELRREVFAIIEAESQSPGPFDVNRMVERLHGAFNNQGSTQRPTIAMPPTPEALTPSTTNTSHTSTGRSSQAPLREEYQETPSLRNASRRIAKVTGEDSGLIEPMGDELDGEPVLKIAASPPPWPLFATQIPEGGSASGFGLVSPIPVRDFFGEIEPFDFEQYMEQIEATNLNIS